MYRHVSQGGQTRGNNVSATKIALGKHEMFLNLIGNISASGEVNCVSATMWWANTETLEKTWRITMFPQQCFLVCPRLKFTHGMIKCDLRRVSRIVM
jgi:hypothetical protein